MEKNANSFAHHDDFWRFAASVKGDRRFVHTREVASFLRAIAASAEKRALKLPRGHSIWRAQIGGHREPRFRADRVGSVTGPFKPGRMKPIDSLAREGRVNPAGIAYLYAADNPDTAVAEVRPWIGAWVSVGEFRLTREARFVDCTRGRRRMALHLEEPSPAEREKCVWRDANAAFAQPVLLDEAPADYVPTQVLAELFASEGFDGIVYKSSCSKGKNIAVFNPYLAELYLCRLHTVKALSYRQVMTGAVYLNGGSSK